LAGTAHPVAQAPQWCGSVVRSVHAEPQSDMGARQSVSQCALPPAVEHSGVAPEHAIEHEPHVAGKPRSDSQPSAAMPLQSAQPESHRNEHACPPAASAVHAGIAWGGDAHATHAMPQFATSLSLTHAPPHEW
jgi:hypothetical protein